jgi:hypothetical protein
VFHRLLSSAGPPGSGKWAWRIIQAGLGEVVSHRDGNFYPKIRKINHIYLQSYATYGYMAARGSAPVQAFGVSLMVPAPARQTSSPVRAGRDSGRQTLAFTSAEEAWLWTMAALIARREGARYTANQGVVARPCDPDDVVKCLDVLYRQKKLDLAHVRILRIWGERQIPPSAALAAEQHDYRLWTEALQRLEWPLRVKAIVA